MIKVITYGTYDLLHRGHIRLLERAKKLGDYLIVAITTDDFDRRRGKINVQQSLIERIEAVRATGLADEIIVEEYEGQKIDDIKRYDIDIFAIGSDWKGKFDYLNEYCKVIYLDRTEGISSSEIRSAKRTLKLGIVGNNKLIEKYIEEDKYVNGLEISAICTENNDIKEKANLKSINIYENYNEMLQNIDAVYIATNPQLHYNYIKTAFEYNKHVLCESPVAICKKECEELYEIAETKKLILSDGIKTIYSTAFNRLILLAKSGIIGNIVLIDSTCTSLKEKETIGTDNLLGGQNSICAWGPTALLPVFSILGTDYTNVNFTTWFFDKEKTYDLFTKINIDYSKATCSVKIAKGVKAEGELIIGGTDGYIYVPAPWWKTDYFEVRFEDESKNKRYFYQLNREGISYELVNFIKSIENKKSISYIEKNVSIAISSLIEEFYLKNNTVEINGENNE